MPHEIFTVLRCKLCPPAHAKAITGPSTFLTAGANHRQVGEFVKALTDHISTAHPQRHEFLQQKMLEFFGLQCIMQYSTTDDGVRYSRDILRWNIHQATLDARIPDDKLAVKSKEFAEFIVSMVLKVTSENDPVLSPDAYMQMIVNVTAKVTEVFRGIRDVLQEPNPPALPSSLKGRL